MAYLPVERGNDFILPLQKVRAGQVHARNGVVRDEGAVAGQVLDKELQFLEHFFFRQRRKFSALCFFQERRSGEQGQAAYTDEHGLALTENDRRVNRVVTAVFSACRAVEEGHPEVDTGFVKLVALLDDVQFDAKKPLFLPVIQIIEKPSYRE